MRRLLLLALVVSIALGAFAQKKPKSEKREVPDAVLVAQFVYVTGWHGDEFDIRVPAEERAAISRVQSALREWGRYRLVYAPDQADIMLVVKPGHLGMVQGGVGLGRPDVSTGGAPVGRPSIGPGISVGAEAGDPGDYLMVSLFPSNSPVDANYIWRRSRNNGFVGRRIPLLEEFKKAVDQSEKAKADSAKPASNKP